ncbi:hypothetical protein D0867_11055 [Hortaea werneckii]|uniref:Methyltransferase type 11 domain-containing protein n=1 Tax=Hortaea werneckii TaxID=91943 RepID=A0A3M6YHV6_HORWE|nr:hypothetical protein D0867_11055 [Hortaea werneckii]
MAHNTYLPGYAPKQVQHHEWRNAENSAAYLLPTLQQKAKDNPQLALLDVGAGSGTITASLAKYMPQGQITATDLSEEILSRAKAFADQAGVSNISFQQASVYELPFPEGSFDIVHASMVLCHLDSPVQALKEMLRVAKPDGGIIACRESDLRMWSYHPQLSGLEKTHRLLMTVHEAAGGSIDGGAKLVSWAMQADATRDQITASFGTWCYSTPEERAIWGEWQRLDYAIWGVPYEADSDSGNTMAERVRHGGMRQKGLEMNITTETELQEMAEAWDEWVATEDACLGCMHGELIITK